MLQVILILGFLATIFIIQGLYNLFFAKRIVVKERLDFYTRQEEGYEPENLSLKEFLLSIIVAVTNLVTRKSYLREKRIKLNQAYVFMRPEEFIGLSILFGLGFGALIYLLLDNIIIGIIVFFVGYKLPDLYLSSIKKKRVKKLNSQLPDALSIISNGLRAGFSFPQAMSVAASELESPIKDEFNKIVRDNSIGKTMDEALNDFSARTDDEDIDMFVTAILIQRKVGGNLTEVLDTIAATIRDRMRIRGEIQTLTAQGRFSAIIISLLPFGVALMIFIMNREYMMVLFQSTIGLIMVGLAILMQVIGMFLISRMVDIEI